ncbi:MAG TPA: hypothetical protein VHQ65_16685 [Thermoanaerobaculia bacterium]|nr:hypothetical protein [Thermoanaerobaculia bacterium]
MVWRWRDEAGGGGGGADGPADAEAARRARLRREGLIRGAVGLVAAALLALWKPLFAVVVAAIALTVLLMALASPTGAYAKLSGWVERFAHGVGMAVTWVLMPVLYYLLFLPVGVARRTFGKLRFETRPAPDQPTYWVEPPAGRRWGRGGAHGVAPYRRQF